MLSDEAKRREYDAGRGGATGTGEGAGLGGDGGGGAAAAAAWEFYYDKRDVDETGMTEGEWVCGTHPRLCEAHSPV